MPDCHAKERTRPALPWGRWVALPHRSGVCIWVSETGVAGRAGAPGRGTTQTHRATFLRTALPPRGHCNRLRSPLKRQNQSVPLKTESHRLLMDGGRRPRSAPVGPTVRASSALRTRGPLGGSVHRMATAALPGDTWCPQASPRSRRASQGLPAREPGGSVPRAAAAFPRARGPERTSPTPAATSRGAPGGTAREEAEAGPRSHR